MCSRLLLLQSVVKQTLKAQGEEGEESESEDDGEIREVLGGKQAAVPTAPPPSAAEAQAQLLQQQLLKQQAAAAAAAPAGAPPPVNPLQQIGITEEQLAAMPPEVQARVKAAQALASKLASQGPPAAPLVPPPVPQIPAGGITALSALAAAWQPGMPLPGTVPGAMLPGAVPAAAAQPAAVAAAAATSSVTSTAAGATWQPAAQPPPPPGSPPPPENPILAAAQAAARRLGKEAGIPTTAYVSQQQQQQMAPGMAGMAGMVGMQQQQMGMPGVLAPGSVPQLPPSLAAQMLPPGGGPMQLPMQLPMQPPALPGAVPQLPPSLAAQMLPPGGGMMQLPMQPPGLPGGVAGQVAQPPVPTPSKHFETELEINDFPQHARWKVGGCGRGVGGWMAPWGAGGARCTSQLRPVLRPQAATFSRAFSLPPSARRTPSLTPPLPAHALPAHAAPAAGHPPRDDPRHGRAGRRRHRQGQVLQAGHGAGAAGRAQAVPAHRRCGGRARARVCGLECCVCVGGGGACTGKQGWQLCTLGAAGRPRRLPWLCPAAPPRMRTRPRLSSHQPRMHPPSPSLHPSPHPTHPTPRLQAPPRRS